MNQLIHQAMPAHSDRQISPYTPEQLYALVADVERYPEFLPWCRAARILERAEGEFLAELAIHFKGLTERYTSRVVLSPPYKVEATLVRGPFSHLTNRWQFTALPQGGTEIDFFLDFAFRSKLLEAMLGGMFARAQSKMIEAFRARADALYAREQV